MIIDILLQELSTDETNGWKVVVNHRGTDYQNAVELLAKCTAEYIHQPSVKAMRYTLTITKED